MLIIIGKRNFEKAVERLAEESVQRVDAELQGIKSLSDLSAKVKEKTEQLEKLTIEKGRKEEEYARKEREIEHKVGLERKRQEHELAAGKREATLTVREENLKKDRERFEEQMKFQEERFTKEVGYLKEMLSDIVKRLPSAEFTANLTPAKPRR